MKTVFHSSEIAHIWANQNHAHGRSAGNGSFQGKCFLSYSTEIGRVLEPGRAVLLNTTSYSNSTSKVQGRMHRAVHHFPIKFYVSGLDRGNVLSRLDGRALHDYYTRSAAKCVTDSQKPRIRQTTREALLAQASGYLEDANRANDYFKLRRAPLTHEDVENVAKRIRNQDARAARAHQKALAEAEERARVRAEQSRQTCARLAPRLVELWRNRCDVLETNEWQALLMEMRAAGVNTYQIQEFASSQTSAEGFNGNALLRLDAGQTRVETSQGAQVLVRTVRFLWEFCANARQQKTAVSSALIERFPTLDHYRLSEIDAHGNVTAGCHRIAFSEIQSIAYALELPPFNGQPMQPAEMPAQEVQS